jgi:hypothetical protein
LRNEKYTGKCIGIFFCTFAGIKERNNKVARITLEYDEKNTIAQKIIDLIYSVDVFEIKEECPYNKEFMKKLERSKKSKNDKAVVIKDLWK